MSTKTMSGVDLLVGRLIDDIGRALSLNKKIIENVDRYYAGTSRDDMNTALSIIRDNQDQGWRVATAVAKHSRTKHSALAAEPKFNKHGKLEGWHRSLGGNPLSTRENVRAFAFFPGRLPDDPGKPWNIVC